MAALCYAWKDRPLRFGASVAGVLAASLVPSPGGPRLLHAERSFFGVHRVREDPTGRYHTLYHGVTLHGAQAVAPDRRCDPLTYYSREGVGVAMEALAPVTGRRVGVVGLGSGSMAGYAKPGESWTYYEIDPVVERIARDPRYFTYLTCAPGLQVVLGDARLSLARAPDRSFDLLVLDAFSSDEASRPPAHPGGDRALPGQAPAGRRDSAAPQQPASGSRPGGGGGGAEAGVSWARSASCA